MRNLLLYSVVLLASFIAAVTSRAASPQVSIDNVTFSDGTLTTITGITIGSANGATWIARQTSATSFVIGGGFTVAKTTIRNANAIDEIEVSDTTEANIVGFASVTGLVEAGTAVNNIFRVDWDSVNQNFTFSKLSDWYNGSGDGTSSAITTLLFISGTTKIYMGGSFTSAGGWGTGRGFAVYDFSGGLGWNQVKYFDMHITGPSYAEPTALTLVNGNVVVSGDVNITSYNDQNGQHATSTDHYSSTWSVANKTHTVF